MQVEFSKVARKTLSDHIAFLEITWTYREIRIFLEDIQRILTDLENGNYQQFQKSTKNTRSFLIGKKHVRMFFRTETNDRIIVLLFFDMKQDPQKIIDLLK
ncbi:type II toxin-antitoxin system RelE/ParE family toxin [Chryseobacterium gregarium]|uniref:type II toxin-antitoxin system RelE/ParE family toxin n=1 Tax=Chryseobacterium gregarium TaxID=456299 RepID=UPI000416B44F|nr:type II toxin-antitoxin system RelE/ParE family toxin [Chryseobacterium gregarium]